MKKFVPLLAPLIVAALSSSSGAWLVQVPSAGGNPFSLFTSISAGGPVSPTTSVATSGSNTTSCTPNCLIIVSTAYFQGGTSPTLTDMYTGCASPCNTWTSIGSASVTADTASNFYYCFNCSVGNNHVFTFTAGGPGCFCAIAVEAWTGATTGLDPGIKSSNTATVASSIQAGSVTPSGNNELIVNTVALPGTLSSINGGFTLDQNVAGISAQTYGIGLSYLKQTTATAANPTDTATGTNTSLAAQNAAFK